MNVNIGNNTNVLLNEFSLLKTKWFNNEYVINEKIPAIRGDNTQDRTIKPILRHTIISAPPYAREKPTIAPIIE